MAQDDDVHLPDWWVRFNLLLIVLSAIPVLYAPVRHVPAFAIPFALILSPTYFILLIRRQKMNGLGNIPLGKLYEQAKSGRRLKIKSLELAAGIAYLLATTSLS